VKKILTEIKQFSGIDGDEKAFALFAKRRRGKVPKVVENSIFSIV